jgi:hypothetical protein
MASDVLGDNMDIHAGAENSHLRGDFELIERWLIDTLACYTAYGSLLCTECPPPPLLYRRAVFTGGSDLRFPHHDNELAQVFALRWRWADSQGSREFFL